MKMNEIEIGDKNMITLDDFISKSQKISKENRGIEVRYQKNFVSQTRKEYRMEDLPLEVRRNPKKFVENAKKQNLTSNQKVLIEMIEKGFKIKFKNRQVIEVEPYRLYYLLLLYKSLNTKKLNEESYGKY